MIASAKHITMSSSISSSHTPPNNNNFKTKNAVVKRCQRNNQSNERLRINLVSLLVTCVVLFAGVKLADGSFIRNINRISETLDRALFNVLEELQGPDYTAINVSATYYATTKFNPQGMAILYNLTNIFMDVLVDKDAYPEGFIIIQDNAIQWDPIKEQWQALLKHFSGLLVIIVILIVLALLFPLWGLCFCCCRCCGNCGAKPQPLDKKRDCCKKFILATFLIAVGTLLLFGVVCAFVTNTHLYEGTANAVPTVKTNMRDVDTYLNATGTELNILLGTNYDEFQVTIFDVLNKSSAIVYEQLAKYSNAVAMTEVTNIVDGLEDIRTNLTQMKSITNYLRNHASQLNDALRKVKNDLIHTLKECNTNSECSKLSSNVSNLDTNIDFNSLPDVTSEMKELENVIDDGDLANSVEEGQQSLKNIELRISQTVSTSLDAVRSAINDAGKEIRTNVGQVNSVLTDISSFMHKHADPILTDADRYIREYAPYLYYSGIGVSCVLLSVTFCIAVGLICGICGKKPDPYSEDCCNKGVGNQCLMCGVTIMFLSGIFLAIITIVFFFIGMASQRLVCDPIRNYNDSKLIDLFDESFSFKDAVGVDVTVKQVLSDCHQNRSAYHVFRLQNKIELDKVHDYLNEFDIQGALDDLQEHIKIPVDVKILSPEAKDKLTELADSNISNINFDRFTTVLDDNLTKVDLNYLVKQLDVVIETVNRRMVPEEIKANLQISKLHLETYQEKLVVPMTQNAEKLIDIAKNMEQNLKFGKSSFREAITELIDEVEKAEEYLQQNGTSILSAIATNFTLAIRGQVVGYLDRVVDNIDVNIGQCGPLSNVLNATLTATCDRVLLPINGLWFVLFWSLLIFTITIILSIKLASLYKKFEYSFAGESEYLYDAYADREIIPLASNGKANKKKKKNKRQEGRSPNFPPERAGDHREFPSGSNQENRYADMAPKQQWEDFPHGGPPQYQRAPTEYERPPPYYYPGNSEQH